jgi:hypothetical protein
VIGVGRRGIGVEDGCAYPSANWRVNEQPADTVRLPCRLSIDELVNLQ